MDRRGRVASNLRGPSATQINTLVSQFVSNYKAKYGEPPPNFNRHRDKWVFRDMIEDLGFGNSKEVIDYYFETKHVGHPFMTLAYDYDQIYRVMREREHDDEVRARLRRESEARVKAWREQRGN